MSENDVMTIIQRIERLEEEKKEIQSDIKEVYAEAKARGYNKKALKQVIKLRKMDPDDRNEMDFLVSEYMDKCQ